MNAVHIHQHMNILKIQWKEQPDGRKDVRKHMKDMKKSKDCLE